MGRTSERSSFSWFAGRFHRMVGLALALTVATAVSAQDYERQVKLLSIVFLGQQFSNMCAIERPTFLDETRGPLGPMSVYAQHIKEEVVSGLPPDQIPSVLVRAANAARAGTRTLLAEFTVGSAMVDRTRLLNWCETTAKPYTLKIMVMHDHQHDLFRCDRSEKNDQGFWLRDCASFFGSREKQLYGR